MISKALAAAALLLLAVPAPAKVKVRGLLKELGSARGTYEVQVVRSLGRSDNPEAVLPLIRLFDIKKGSVDQSRAIIEALGELGDPAAVDPLMGAWDYLSTVRLQLGDQMPSSQGVLRGALAKALIRLGGGKTASFLQNALEDEDPAVVCGAVEAVGLRKDKKAVEALIQLLPRGGDVARTALAALGQIGDKRASAALKRALQSEDLLIRIRAAAAYARLGKEGEAGVSELVRVCENRQMPAEAVALAAHALASMDDRRGLDHLTRLLRSDDARARLLAISSLGSCGNARAVPPLAKAAETAAVQEKTHISRALAQLGGRRAISALKKLAEDRSVEARNAARLALAELGEAF